MQFTEGFMCQRIKPTLPVRAHRDKSGFAQNAHMPRDTRLLDSNFCDKVVYLLLSRREPLRTFRRVGSARTFGIKRLVVEREQMLSGRRIFRPRHVNFPLSLQHPRASRAVSEADVTGGSRL